ncbi:MAG: RHS repeat-associated core domain-containing protein, partial [Gammaproteobacteria bacterium]
ELCAEDNHITGDFTRFFGDGAAVNGEGRYYHRDHLGSVRAVTDDSGAVKAAYAYGPYGRRTALTGNATDSAFGFTGHYVHQATGLALAPFRAYDANIGRWISRDPVGEAGGVNLYTYVGNNPLRWIDPLGLFVTGSYDSATGQLTLTDQDTGNSVTTQAESGGKPFGDPIPSGTYDILERQGRPDFYRLDKQDSFPFDDVDHVTGRDHFRLHRPGRTIGCIAVKNAQDWKQVDELIKNTKQTDLVPDNFKPWWKFWSNSQQDLRRYGTLTVH